MGAIAQHQLQGVFTRREGQCGLHLSFAKVQMVFILGDGLADRRQFTAINQ